MILEKKSIKLDHDLETANRGGGFKEPNKGIQDGGQNGQLENMLGLS